jgi:hypothetical protein
MFRNWRITSELQKAVYFYYIRWHRNSSEVEAFGCRMVIGKLVVYDLAQGLYAKCKELASP